MSAAEPMEAPAFKPGVQIEPSEEVPVGCKFLNMSDGAQAVGRRLGVRCVAGSTIADGPVTARSQGVWLDCNDEFILDEVSIAGSLNRETRNVCARSFAGNSHPVFSQQVSKSRAQGCRWTEAKLK